MESRTMKGPLYCAIFYCLIIFVASQGFTCDPAADCSNAPPGSKVPDPTDCERFYVCITNNGETIPSTISVQCAEGQYFDQVATECVAETTPGTCGPNICPIRYCESECPHYVLITYVADRYSCNSYYICLLPGAINETCPSATPYFDGLTSTCVDDASKCCDFCTAYCPMGGIEIVDPCDCSSFYICIEEGPASEELRLSCDPGTYFDEDTAACLSGTCNNICSNCGTNSPTTTVPTTTAPPIETTTTQSTISTPTTPLGGCTSLASYACPGNGNFPMCPYCFKYFFVCSGSTATIGECSGNALFNPNPGFPYCLESCPYP